MSDRDEALADGRQVLELDVDLLSQANRLAEQAPFEPKEAILIEEGCRPVYGFGEAGAGVG